MIWLGLVQAGFIKLAGGARAQLSATSEQCYGDGLINPDQGTWQWDPAAVSGELDRLALEADAHGGFVDYLYDRFNAQA